MGKKKTGRRGGSGSIGSPRVKQGDEPVTDTVMQVIARRVRNARKKLQKVSHIEGLMEEGENLNEDQERVYRTKEPLTAVIEELLKLEPLVEAALGNEVEERLSAAKEEWEKEAAAVVPVRSEGESEVMAEGPSGVKAEEEETKEEVEVPDEETADAAPSATDEMFDNAIEALYFVQLFAKGKFDLAPFVGDATEEKEGIISAEEIEILENFGKKIFQTTSHVPREALESAKEAGKCLMSASSDEATKVFEVVRKLKESDVMENELKLTVHGFPIAIEKEETQLPEPTTTQEPTIQTDENPPPSSPVYHTPHFIQPETVPVPPRSPRPFLPFPAATMSGPPSMGFAMTQTPSIIGMHSFYSMAPVPGHFITPAQFPGVHAPPIIPTAPEQPPIDPMPAEASAPQDTPETADEPIQEPEAMPEEGVPEEEEPEEEPQPTCSPEASRPQDADEESVDPFASRPPENPPQRSSPNLTGRFPSRGRYPISRGTPRGRPRGRHVYGRHADRFGRRRGGYDRIKDGPHY